MKAIVLRAYGSVENLIEQIVPDPPPLLPDEVLVRIKAISFNPIDSQIRKGGSEAQHVQSLILGRDLSGVILGIGADVVGWQAGDEIIAYASSMGSNGTYSELVNLPANILGRKPPALSFEEAAAIPMVGLTALQTLEQCRFSPDDTILVIGASGGVGSFFLPLARRNNLTKIIATFGSDKSKQHILSLGLSADWLIQYDSPRLYDEIFAHNGHRFVDAVVDFAGGTTSEVAAQVLNIGGQYADIAFLLTEHAVSTLFDKSATIRNIAIYAYALSSNRADWSYYGEKLATIAALFDDKTLSAPLIENIGTFSAENVQKAHIRLEENTVKGKLVMTISA